jgi:hypothetical protein
VARRLSGQTRLTARLGQLWGKSVTSASVEIALGKLLIVGDDTGFSRLQGVLINCRRIGKICDAALSKHLLYILFITNFAHASLGLSVFIPDEHFLMALSLTYLYHIHYCLFCTPECGSVRMRTVLYICLSAPTHSYLRLHNVMHLRTTLLVVCAPVPLLFSQPMRDGLVSAFRITKAGYFDANLMPLVQVLAEDPCSRAGKSEYKEWLTSFYDLLDEMCKRHKLVHVLEDEDAARVELADELSDR